MSTHNQSPPPPPPRHKEWKLGCKVYIGNLAEAATKADIEDSFSKYGPLRNVWVARNPPGFAFVEFEDGRDAEDACRHLDGTRIAGGRIKAEMSHGRSRRGRGAGGGGGGGGSPGFRGHPAPYPMMQYGGPPVRGYGAPPPPPRGHYGDYPPPPMPYGGHHHNHYGGPPPMRGGYHHGGHMDRPRERHVPRQPRIPIAMKDSYHHRRPQHHRSRSRSNSIDKSPPPPPHPVSQQQQQQQQQPIQSQQHEHETSTTPTITQQPTQTLPPRAARPRTPPSRSVSPDRN